MSKEREPTLSDILASLGWRHEPIDDDRRRPNKRRVYDDKGQHVGDLDCFECWALLRQRGLA